MAECIFCKIARKEVKANIVYSDKDVLCFEDINPQAPVHVVLIPRKHIERLSDINESTIDIAGKLILAAVMLARSKKIELSGYRIVINCNKDAGQEVFHLHLHLLGGRKFGWPPG